MSTTILAEPAGTSGASHSLKASTVEEALEYGNPRLALTGTHIVLQGIVTADSIRCDWAGSARIAPEIAELHSQLGPTVDEGELPSREEIKQHLETVLKLKVGEDTSKERTVIDLIVDGGYSEDLLTLICYADYQVTRYILGTGPEKATVAYGGRITEYSWDLVRKTGGISSNTGGEITSREQYEEEILQPSEEALRMALTHALSDRETIVFLHPAAPMERIATLTWSAVSHWDIQRDIEGQLLAVRYGTWNRDPEHSQTVEELRDRIESAAATDALAGKRLGSMEDITRHYREMGAYGDLTPYDDSDETFTPIKPRPPYAPGEGEPVPTATPRPQPTKAPTPTSAPKRILTTATPFPDDYPSFQVIPRDITVDRNAPPGTTVATITASPGTRGTPVSYSLEQPETDLFSIHPWTGVITLARRVEDDETPVHIVNVRAAGQDDRAIIAIVRITLDERTARSP